VVNGLGSSSLVMGLSGTASVPSLREPTLWEKFLFQLGALSGEYLFVIGAMLIACLLLTHRRWWSAAGMLCLALLWLSFHLPVSLYLESLGADSFAETHHFDLDEARFWLQTLREAVQPDFSPKKFAAYLAFSLLAFYSLRWLFHRHDLTRRAYAASKVALSLGLIVLAFHQTTSKALAFYLENTEKFQTTASRFETPAPPASLEGPPLDLVVYIGESTSAMNMGLYGYGRPTTPELSAWAARDRQLVVFEHVFATHAHTSRSLLEALSFGRDASERYLPITERHRISVVDVLKSAGLQSRLLSNQGQGGSWDQASSVIFRHSQNTFRARALTAAKGQAAERPWDDEFFEDQLDRLPPHSGQVLFLHSYAGHGPYHKNIPERFRRPVDAQLQTLGRERVVRDSGASLAQIEEYDAAIRYVDHSLSKILSRLQHSPRPTVLVYFSDHGDAVYAGIGHDSARFRHEMARVPFLMYFNDAAARQRPDLLAKYSRLAQARRIATLAQLPSTLLDLLGVRTGPSEPPLLLTPVIGEAAELPPILVRQTAEGVTFVQLGGPPAPAFSPSGQRLIDRTDEDTRRYLAARSPGLMKVEQACPAQPATLEEASRNTLLMGCPARALPASTPTH